jgi:hypothetical protein
MASRQAAAEPDLDDAPEQEAYSGRLLLRMPQTLHGELARAAGREGVSLNTYITAALSASVGWRSAERESGPSRLVRAALIADLVLVAVAAAAAIALLLVAVL